MLIAFFHSCLQSRNKEASREEQATYLLQLQHLRRIGKNYIRSLISFCYFYLQWLDKECNLASFSFRR
ncbi:hypothetical protein A946_10410 [Methylacidiphilum kamchatkense Kam1]|uniref:Integrase-like protein n=1 Tax=Methylacidiphilum kamchatkense Kam1 TaxID=1202785 RepID=A0ABR4ZWJ0_9BACT|nr:hypothetical protein A946_10410 [Methylacidiphilum kamchatkense Kam1]